MGLDPIVLGAVQNSINYEAKTAKVDEEKWEKNNEGKS